MRRVLLAVYLIALGFAGAPQATAIEPGRAVCEGYCVVVGGGCYVFLSLFMGKEKCDSMYKGCVEGCVAGLVESRMERE
ncbi:MAG: hypothetical protein JSV86_21225 [Gemmatimonadota bacterium]|nr:MAG: hypothetical protein JSV86_21225 [Gemmatimonadota bacterium]